ncbi:M15 family metallopeptidase [Spongiibacter sp. KMU-158]|uniref:M15 family metallopeptidase n=1 Tax=Spongiibacter pelagi TaxID=2760804 RepID=A0A927C307_9GAMM|nr:M15 family metallopeptidase [Spongiibacter pelagi]MBD2858846.1 M15 family metallopeptidase [Spongiibacter pelagi]
MVISDALLLGQDEPLMVCHMGRVMHPDLVAPLTALQTDAEREGFDLRVVSGFRSFERQLAIWNAKAQGQRPLYDEHGELLDFASLSEEAVLWAILRWSALPGASRHHWGSDIDIYDAAAVAEDYQVQLSPEEVADDGVFGPMHQWLDTRLGIGAGYGFFRPYDEDRGGVAPERWHLSFAPLSARCEHARNKKVLRAAIEAADIQLKDLVLKHFDDIFERYVDVPASCYPSAYAALLEPRQELVGV